MSMSEKIKIAMVKRNDMSLKVLAEKIGTTPQNLSNKFKRDNFSEKEIHEIAEALDCKFEGYLIMNNGDKI